MTDRVLNTVMTVTDMTSTATIDKALIEKDIAVKDMIRIGWIETVIIRWGLTKMVTT